MSIQECRNLAVDRRGINDGSPLLFLAADANGGRGDIAVGICEVGGGRLAGEHVKQSPISRFYSLCTERFCSY